MDERAGKTGARRLVAVAYATDRSPWRRHKYWSPPGPVHDAVVLGLFIILGLGLLVANLLPG